MNRRQFLKGVLALSATLALSPKELLALEKKVYPETIEDLVRMIEAKFPCIGYTDMAYYEHGKKAWTATELALNAVKTQERLAAKVFNNAFNTDYTDVKQGSVNRNYAIEYNRGFVHPHGDVDAYNRLRKLLIKGMYHALTEGGSVPEGTKYIMWRVKPELNTQFIFNDEKWTYTNELKTSIYCRIHYFQEKPKSI